MTLFKSIVRVAARNTLEKVGEEGFESILALVIRGTIQFALGPTGFVIPLYKLAVGTIEISYKTILEIGKTDFHGTSYDLRTTSSGLLVAENLKPSKLSDIPLPLPEYSEISLNEIRQPDQYAPLFSPLSVPETNAVFTSIGLERRRCDECEYYVLMPSDHAFSCSQNPRRYTCDVCGGKFGSHTKNCPRQYQRGWKCGECGRWIDKAENHAPTCSHRPKEPTYNKFRPRGIDLPPTWRKRS